MGPWQHNIELLLRGIYPSQYPGSVVYKPWQIVDVRDCAAGHVGLLESVTVKSGERYIAWSTEMIELEYMGNRIATLLPELGYTPPEPKEDPNAITREGADCKAEMEAIWHACDLRNDRIKAATGVTFRPFDETLRDCVESLVAVAGVETGSFKAKM